MSDVGETKFSVKFQKSFIDIILSTRQSSIAEYQQHNVRQRDLPALITELVEKGYELVKVFRPRREHVDE